MSQTPRTRSVRATKEGLEKVRQTMAELEKPGKQDYKGWSQEDLAERSEVSLSTVKRFLNEEQVDRQTIIQITRALGFQPTDIVAPLEWNPPEQTSSAIPWHEVCHTMLGPQQELGSNRLLAEVGDWAWGKGERGGIFLSPFTFNRQSNRRGTLERKWRLRLSPTSCKRHFCA